MALEDFFQTYTTDNLGQIFLTGNLNVEPYRKVNFMLITESGINMTVNCEMGTYSGGGGGGTLALSVAQFALEFLQPVIHSFDVIGPEFRIVLTGGPPNTDVALQGWLLLQT
jgi:hypothetical protein